MMDTAPTNITAFVGNVPQNYESYMVPIFMRPFAEDLAKRIAKSNPTRILELAAGTGILTECVHRELPNAEIVATDLNEDMISHAQSVRPQVRANWKTADAMDLPFPDESYDVVAMQFGYMFIPQQIEALKEIYRVLKPGGRVLFSTWDALEKNELTSEAKSALVDQVEPGPPKFLDVPFAMHDPAPILQEMQMAGFETSTPAWVTTNSVSKSAEDAANGIVFGTPLFGAIKDNNRDADAVRDHLAQAFSRRFGGPPVESKMQAIVFEGRKPA
jgi:SAM-dependent methyltransferase